MRVGYDKHWLVVSTPLKNMSPSVGMIDYSQLNGEIKFMFQTTNQALICSYMILHVWGSLKMCCVNE